MKAVILVPRVAGVLALAAALFPAASHAESRPPLDKAVNRCVLIVKCKVEVKDHLINYRVVESWKGEYRPDLFYTEPLDDYLYRVGAETSASRISNPKDGQEVVVFYSDNAISAVKKGKILNHAYDDIFVVQNGKVVYELSNLPEPSADRHTYTVDQFKKAILTVVASDAAQKAKQDEPTSIPSQQHATVPVPAEGADDTIRFYLSKSKVCVSGVFVEALGASGEQGVVHYICEVEVAEVLAGKLDAKRIRVGFVRLEFKETDKLPFLKEKEKCIIFLSGQTGQVRSISGDLIPAFVLADRWFGLQSHNADMVDTIRRVAPSKASDAGESDASQKATPRQGRKPGPVVEGPMSPLGAEMLRHSPNPAGRWRLTMPAGFEYDATLEPLEPGLYRLTCGAANLRGVYMLDRGRYLSMKTPEDERLVGLVWEFKNHNTLILTEHPKGSQLGSDYTNATLRRKTTDSKDGVKSADQRIEGTWAVVSVESPESSAADAAGDVGLQADLLREAKLDFWLDSPSPASVVNITKATGMGRSIIQQLDFEVQQTDKPPHTIDFIWARVGKDGLRETLFRQQGIYEINGQELRICVAPGRAFGEQTGPVRSDSNARPTRLDRAAGLLVTLKRESPIPADWPPRTTVEELDAMCKAGNYHLIREQKIGHRIESTGTVESIGKSDGPSWLFLKLPGDTWQAQLLTVSNDDRVKPGDRVKFRALIVDESYSALWLWAYSWSKVASQVPQQEASK